MYCLCRLWQWTTKGTDPPLTKETSMGLVLFFVLVLHHHRYIAAALRKLKGKLLVNLLVLLSTCITVKAKTT